MPVTSSFGERVRSNFLDREIIWRGYLARRHRKRKGGRRRRKKMGKGAKDSEVFSKSGPYHITTVDWTDSYHRAAVTSCLVNAVYVMQRDKAKKREPLAYLWWAFFRFSLVETLINEADSSIYGAVYKYDNYQNTSAELMAPSYVIAFRGTLLSFKTVFSDLKQNCRCIWENLSHGRRLKHAVQAIKTVLDLNTSEPTSVWLAGHSLGAGIALLAGKQMARYFGIRLETYAFNPPNTSFPLEQVSTSEVLKGGFRIANSFFRGTLSFVVSLFDDQIQKDDPSIAEWIPKLFVNSEDIICSEYIGDFKHKKFMSKIKLGKIVRARERISLRSLLFGGSGTLSSRSGESIQLLSSADMIINRNKSTVHGIVQWYEPDPALGANWERKSIRRSI